MLASAWLGILTPIWASLTVFPLYWLGRQVYGEKTGRLGVLWWPLVPSLLMFTPYPSTSFPVLSVLAVALFVRGLIARQSGWFVASGFVLSIFTFMTFSSLPMIPLLGILTLLVYWLQRMRWQLAWWWPLSVGCYVTLGLASVWVLYGLISGVPAWDVFRASLNAQNVLDRPYLPWVFLQFNDFAMFTGWPLILLALVGTGYAVREVRKGAAASLDIAFALTLALAVLALDLAGIVRGENGRIWLFLSPFLVLIAAGALKPIDRRSAWLFTATEALIVLAMVSSLHVIDSGLDKRPADPPSLAQQSKTPTLPGGEILGAGALRLNSFSGQVDMQPDSKGRPQPTLNLWLAWESLGQVDRPYYLALIPVSPDGKPLQATLIQPFDGKYPVTCWSPANGVIHEQLAIPLNGADPKGDWWVSLSLIDGRNGYKPPVSLPDGSTDVQVGIGPFRQSGGP
jgi:hypothetical protein